MTEKKPPRKPDPTARRRVAALDQRRRAAGLVPISIKVWVPERYEKRAREILDQAKSSIKKAAGSCD
ncbi:hypothetical protein [Thioalkalivibrio thiocyanodenitrificans]|uniref:hypothetical protein n=1 Tax=Thioalkalivibrio thiocyanodenitrificans TaxID=243063 RepID=UPI00036E3048|nr:hypothetical protein [Thioalkalivibrio thiocyanodenitrificans]